MVDRIVIEEWLAALKGYVAGLKKVYDVLHNQVGDFESFAAYVGDFLKKSGRENK